MTRADRLIVGFFAAGLWALVLLEISDVRVAFADTDPDYGQRVEAYRVEGLKPFIELTVQRCKVTHESEIRCPLATD